MAVLLMSAGWRKDVVGVPGKEALGSRMAKAAPLQLSLKCVTVAAPDHSP